MTELTAVVLATVVMLQQGLKKLGCQAGQPALLAGPRLICVRNQKVWARRRLYGQLEAAYRQRGVSASSLESGEGKVGDAGVGGVVEHGGRRHIHVHAACKAVLVPTVAKTADMVL